MEEIKYGSYIDELLSTKRQPRVKQGIYMVELVPTRREPRIRKGIYTGQLIITKRQPRVRKGIGLNTILREIVIESDDIKLPRVFPLEYSWTKNI